MPAWYISGRPSGPSRWRQRGQHCADASSGRQVYDLSVNRTRHQLIQWVAVSAGGGQSAASHGAASRPIVNAISGLTNVISLWSIYCAIRQTARQTGSAEYPPRGREPSVLIPSESSNVRGRSCASSFRLSNAVRYRCGYAGIAGPRVVDLPAVIEPGLPGAASHSNTARRLQWSAEESVSVEELSREQKPVYPGNVGRAHTWLSWLSAHPPCIATGSEVATRPGSNREQTWAKTVVDRKAITCCDQAVAADHPREVFGPPAVLDTGVAVNESGL